MVVQSGGSGMFRAASQRTRAFARAGRLLIAVTFATVLAPPAWSQQYKSDPVDEKARNNKNAVLASAAGAKNFAADKQNVLDFFSKYLIPSMTRYEPADLEKLGSARYLLVNQVLWKTTDAS